MKRVEAWKAFLFCAVLFAVAAVINVSMRPFYPPKKVQQTIVLPPLSDQAPAPLPQPAESTSPTVADTSKPAEIVAPPKIWPDDFPPTRTIRIPDRVRPSTGVMDLTFHPGDDLQFEIEQWWTLKFENIPQELEFSRNKMMKDFKTPETRKGRTRVKPGTEKAVSVRLIIDKKNPENYKPLPPIDSKTFGNLRFNYRKLQGLRNNTEFMIDFEAENTDRSRTIGLAIHGPRTLSYEGEVALVGSFTDSDGTEYSITQIAGLNHMHSLPSKLASIGPGERRQASLRFLQRSGVVGRPTSFTFRCEFVINPDFTTQTYSGYRPNGELPPGCRIETLIWEIPIRYNDE